MILSLWLKIQVEALVFTLADHPVQKFNGLIFVGQSGHIEVSRSFINFNPGISSGTVYQRNNSLTTAGINNSICRAYKCPNRNFCIFQVPGPPRLCPVRLIFLLLIFLPVTMVSINSITEDSITSQVLLPGH